MDHTVNIHVRIVNVFLIHRAKAIPLPRNKVHNTQGRSFKVDFMVDPNGCITAHTCAFSIILPRLKYTANEDNFLLFQEALMAVIQPCTKEFNMA